MIVDIANLNLHDRPVLILKNLDEKPVTNLGNAFNIRMDIAYNEVSSITFDIPAYVNGVSTPDYDLIVGTRLVDFVGVGMFILVDPETTGNGVTEIKSCKAYSREYEMTYKKMSLPEGTYNFYNTVAPANTILGIICEYLPYWSIGSVDSNLIGKYRTFSISDVNIYDFIKNTCQKTYGCIFDFDTYNRTINVRSTANEPPIRPVYLSNRNLAKEIERKEDTENIFTCLDVNGASGVTIRSVNPLGTNKIYNLDYYMNLSNFSRDMVVKWITWKNAVKERQDEYYLLTVQRMLKTSEIVSLEAKIDEATNAELGALEAQQSVCIEALARLSEGSSGYSQALANLTSINAQIAAKESAISSDTASLATLEAEKDALTESLVDINEAVSFEAFFTNEELMLLKQYFKEDAITDSSFVYPEAKNYSAEDVSRAVSGVTTLISGSTVSSLSTGVGRSVYRCGGGSISVGTILSAAVISATAEFTASSSHMVLTAYLGAGTIGTTAFPNGCLTMVTDGGSASATATSLSLSGGSGNLYFTRNTTEYEKYSVEWDLYEYGMDCLSKLAYPSYSFSVESANFFSMEEFAAFKNNIVLGQKIYLDLGNDVAQFEEINGSIVGTAIVGKAIVGGGIDGSERMILIAPIFTGFSIDFEDPSSLSLKFGDKYNQSDASFSLVDLLEQSVSMGKTVDTSRFGYNAFIDSGASTAVKDYMDSALDVAKQAILSSTGVSIEWDESGMTFRKKKTAPQTGYEDTQIKIINDNIVFTDDAWQTAKMAIGHFVDTNAGDSWGVIAPNVVGTLLAGENLVIESNKKSSVPGTQTQKSVFKVDADGAVLYNSQFDIVRANTVAPGVQSTSTHILLDPDLGFGLGTYPVKNPQTGAWDTTNAKFYVDMAGNVHMKGTLDAADGTFSGSLSAATGTFSGELIAAIGTFNGIVRASDYQILKNGQYVSMQNSADQFKADYLDLKGITITDNNSNTTFSVDSDGNVSVSGNITMGPGSTVSWSQVTGTSGVTMNSDFGDSSTTAGAVAHDADLALTTAGNAISTAESIAMGTYHTSAPTFIDGNSIYSPEIHTNLLTIWTQDVSDNGTTSPGGFVIKGKFINDSWFDAFKITYQDIGTAPVVNITCGGDLHMPGFFLNGTFINNQSSNPVNVYGKFDFTGSSLVLPYGTSLQRPTNPYTGMVFFQLD